MHPRLSCALVLAAAVVAGACGQYFHKDDFLPTSPSIVNAIKLTSSAGAISANGFSTVTVTASITADAALKNRVVVFDTSAGTFVGSGSPETTSIERTVDSLSSASVELRSSRTVETARVTAHVKDVAGLTSNEQLVKFVAAAPQDIIRISANSTAPADGATITAITAEISGSLPAGRRRVTFGTSLGQFVGSSSLSAPAQHVDVDADGGNRAVAYLRSPGDSTGTAFVTATVDASPTVTATTSVQFTPASPQRVLVTTDQPTVKQAFGPTIKVTATLVRDSGVPTQQTIVTFKAVDSGGVGRGVFTNISRSDAKGEATADFAPGTSSALGTMVITASVESVSGTATVEVVP